jgi:hypothetical protein
MKLLPRPDARHNERRSSSIVAKPRSSDRDSQSDIREMLGSDARNRLVAENGIRIGRERITWPLPTHNIRAETALPILAKTIDCLGVDRARYRLKRIVSTLIWDERRGRARKTLQFFDPLLIISRQRFQSGLDRRNRTAQAGEFQALATPCTIKCQIENRRQIGQLVGRGRRRQRLRSRCPCVLFDCTRVIRKSSGFVLHRLGTGAVSGSPASKSFLNA